MKVEEYWKISNEFSGKASDISRQLAFAAIAVIWLFKIDTQSSSHVILATSTVTCARGAGICTNINNALARSSRAFTFSIGLIGNIATVVTERNPKQRHWLGALSSLGRAARGVGGWGTAAQPGPSIQQQIASATLTYVKTATRDGTLGLPRTYS
jgi:hypothetical protein